MKRKRRVEEFDVEDMKTYMAMPAGKKLQFLEEINAFYHKFVPAKSKRIAQKLRQMGF